MLQHWSVRALLAGIILGLEAPGTQAGPTARSLQDLITSGTSLTVGDKVFSHFGYTGNSGNHPRAAAITVAPLPFSGIDAFGNFGIRFGLGGFDAPGGGATDFLLTYMVTTVSALPLITDVHLSSNLSFAGMPGAGDHAFGTIVETITAAGVGIVAQLSNSLTTTTQDRFSMASFVPSGPYQTL